MDFNVYTDYVIEARKADIRVRGERGNVRVERKEDEKLEWHGDVCLFVCFCCALSSLFNGPQ